MKTNWIFPIIGIAIIICSCTSNVPTVIKGSLTNIEDTTITIEIGRDPITGLEPANYPKVYEISEDGTFTIPIETPFPVRAVMYSENFSFFARVNLIHKGEIYLNADCIDTKNTLEYLGANGGLSTFSRDIENFTRNAKSEINADSISLSDYEKSLDSLQAISLKMLNDFHNEVHLTKEELHWLTSNIKYGKFVSLNHWAYRKETPPNDPSYQFFQKLDLNDQDAVLVSRTYIEAILDYLLHEVNSNGIYHISSLDNSIYFQKYYETLNAQLSGKVRDVILTNFISDMLKNFDDLAKEYYKYYLADCASPEMLERTRPLYDKYLKIINEPLHDSVNVISTNQQNPMEVLGQFQNSVVLMDFWASWCSPCIRGLPHTRKLAEHYMDRDLVVLYIGNMDQKNNLISAIKEHHLVGNHIILNEEESLAWRSEFDIKGIPTYIVMDRAGRVVHLDNPHQLNDGTYVLIDSLLSLE